jgi:ABC-2 type transport system permease protein
MLPQWAQTITFFNPIFYLVNGFRYGFLGIADVSLWISFTVLFILIGILAVVNMYLIRTGLGLKQ